MIARPFRNGERLSGFLSMLFLRRVGHGDRYRRDSAECGEDERLLLSVKRLELVVRAHLDELLKPSGITALQYTALTVLDQHDGLLAARLARRSFVTAQSTADLVRAFEQRAHRAGAQPREPTGAADTAHRCGASALGRARRRRPGARASHGEHAHRAAGRAAQIRCWPRRGTRSRSNRTWEDGRVSDPADLGVLETAAVLRAHTLSSRELVDACLARIRERDGTHSHDGDPDSIPSLPYELMRAPQPPGRS